MLVVDASVLVGILLREPGVEAAEQVFMTEPDVIAPAGLPNEVVSGLRSAVLRRRIGIDQALAAAVQADALDVDIKPDEPATMAARLGRASAWGLTPYDCAYVGLALASGAVLLTLDAEMRATAERLGVKVLP
jgi:predicted nucleic acid-binding protein